LVIKVNILSFVNEISGIFNKRGGFSDKGLKLVSKVRGKGMSGGSNGAYYRSERDVFFMYFRLTIDPWGLGVVRNKMLLDVRIDGGIFDGFGDHVGDGIDRVFGQRFVSRGREEVKQFGFIVGSVHNN
jgi:hypothetical protein